MICPKCKKEIDDNSLRCSDCGTKVGRLCPNCKTPNVISAMKCKNCNHILLKACPNCSATNTAKSTVCRRCGIEFEKFKRVENADNQQLDMTTKVHESLVIF